MKISTISLFPAIFDALNYGITGRAIEKGLVDLSHINTRDFSLDKHRAVDDKPYGGGPGMVMMVQPLIDAINHAKNQSPLPNKVVCLSPQGIPLTHKNVVALAENAHLILVAGRYEGMDERVHHIAIDEEVSIGDYVLSGGEIPAMVLIDALIRQIPGSLGDEQSAAQDSYVSGLLDYPHYTRPEEILGQNVPKVLLSGDHAAIMRWRKKQALGRTWQRRPDLLETTVLSKEEQALLDEFKSEEQQ